MRAIAIHVVACALAALAPLLPRASAIGGPQPPAASDLIPWPTSFEGRPLTRLPLGARDERFARDFPGHVGRFHDGRRELVLRFVTRPTRRLHPASDCLRAIGHTIEPLPARRGPDGSSWGCFAARRGSERLSVCEQIRDAAGHTWPDASSWYWPALIGGGAGPWWSTTVVETEAN